MTLATIFRYGVRLPPVDWSAFSTKNLCASLGGYARILALMTGIELFANPAAAYRGPAKERSRSVMGTTCLTVLIVGPAIYDLADHSNDMLLPSPLPCVVAVARPRNGARS